MGRSFKKIFSEREILIHCYWVGPNIFYVYKEFKACRFYFIGHMSQRNDYMNTFFRSYTPSTMDVGIYGRSSRPFIYLWEHLCFSKGYFAIKKSKRTFSNIGIDQAISWTEQQVNKNRWWCHRTFLQQRCIVEVNKVCTNDMRNVSNAEKY